MQRFVKLDANWLTTDQLRALGRLAGRRFSHKWQLAEALAQESEAWRPLPDTKTNKPFNKDLKQKFESLYLTFREAP